MIALLVRMEERVQIVKTPTTVLAQNNTMFTILKFTTVHVIIFSNLSAVVAVCGSSFLAGLNVCAICMKTIFKGTANF